MPIESVPSWMVVSLIVGAAATVSSTLRWAASRNLDHHLVRHARLGREATL